jgi:putative transposase
VILMAVRWYLRHPLSATSVMELLAERGIDVSSRTVLRWVQAFGPQLAAEAGKHRRPLGRCWYTDEMFFFRGQDKWYLYRAVDEHGHVVDLLKHSSSRRLAARARSRVRSSLTTISRTSMPSSGPCQRPCTFGAGSTA